MYTCLCCQGETYKKGNGWHSRENSMIREKNSETSALHQREREKDREREIGEETE